MSQRSSIYFQHNFDRSFVVDFESFDCFCFMLFVILLKPEATSIVLKIQFQKFLLPRERSVESAFNLRVIAPTKIYITSRIFHFQSAICWGDREKEDIPYTKRHLSLVLCLSFCVNLNFSSKFLVESLQRITENWVE